MFSAFHLRSVRSSHTRIWIGAAVVVLLAGCQSGKETDAKVDTKFPVPASASTSPPDVNTVPTTTPTPRSTADEREKAIEGLVADRDNARHSEQGARTMPVAVRPLSDTPPPPPQASMPPKPDAVPAAAVARLSEPPPSRPAEAATPSAPAVGPGLGPQAQAVPQGDEGSVSGAIYATVSGYRALTAFETGKYKRTERLAQISLPRGDLSTGDRSVLGNAALRQTERAGVIRIIGHGDGDLRAGQQKASVVAKELERLGVTNASLYVGADQAPGATEVFLHY